MTTIKTDSGTLGFGRYPSTGMSLEHDAREPGPIILDKEYNRIVIHGYTTRDILWVNVAVPLAGIYCQVFNDSLECRSAPNNTHVSPPCRLIAFHAATDVRVAPRDLFDAVLYGLKQGDRCALNGQRTHTLA